MILHPTTFDYLVPTKDQQATMRKMREAARDYAAEINLLIPDGPDKTYCIRKLRELTMWVNVAITRDADGTPRS